MLDQVICAATWNYGDNSTWAAVCDHVWVYGTTTARVWIDLCGPCCHQRSPKCPGSRPHSMAMWAVVVHAVTRDILTWVACAVTWENSAVQAWAATEGHAWVWADVSSVVKGWAAVRASVVTEGQTDNQGSFWCNRTILLATWDHVDARGHAAGGTCRSEGPVMALGPCGNWIHGSAVPKVCGGICG